MLVRASSSTVGVKLWPSYVRGVYAAATEPGEWYSGNFRVVIRGFGS